MNCVPVPTSCMSSKSTSHEELKHSYPECWLESGKGYNEREKVQDMPTYCLHINKQLTSPSLTHSLHISSTKEAKPPQAAKLTPLAQPHPLLPHKHASIAFLTSLGFAPVTPS